MVGRRWLVGALAAVPLAVVAVATLPAHATAPAVPTHPRVYPLPTGDRVQVTGSGMGVHARLLPAPGHSGAAVTSIVDGQLTVVPAAAFAHLASLSGFQVETVEAPSVAAQFAMTLLRVKAVDHEGVPAAAAEVIVINTDDPTRAHWGRILTGGHARNGGTARDHRLAVAILHPDPKGRTPETDLLEVPHVNVPAAGTAVKADGPHGGPVHFTTPQPSVNADLV